MQATRKGGYSLSPEEAAALQFLNATAAREDIMLEMTLEPGDMQFCFNHTVFHSRTDFDDWEKPEDKRHLLRLWLNIPNGRKLAPNFADRYGTGAGLGVPPPGGAVQATMRP
jgi:hypothetical protein